MAGFGRSRQKSSAERLRRVALAGIAAFPLASIISSPSAAGGDLVPYRVVGDAIPEPLNDATGDPMRGRAIVIDRHTGFCLLCHSGPFPEDRLQGNLAPNLGGIGSRYSAGQLRLRIVDAGRINDATLMPPYYRVDGLDRVAAGYAGKPLLSAEQIEDVVAFLAGLIE